MVLRARMLIDGGIPVFVAPPSIDGGISGEFDLPRDRAAVVPDPERLTCWRPSWALCMLTGYGFDGVDVDVKHGANVEQVREQLEAFEVEVVGEVLTPSGGAHFYVHSTGICSSTNRSRGVDFRGRGVDGTMGRFLYLPGTSRPRYGGRGYEWVRFPELRHLNKRKSLAQRGAQLAFLEYLGSSPRTTTHSALSLFDRTGLKDRQSRM